MFLENDEVMTLSQIFMCIVWDTSKLMFLMVTIIGASVYFLKPIIQWLQDLFGSGPNNS